jgi:hypothetical protein
MVYSRRLTFRAELVRLATLPALVQAHKGSRREHLVTTPPEQEFSRRFANSSCPMHRSATKYPLGGLEEGWLIVAGSCSG